MKTLFSISLITIFISLSGFAQTLIKPTETLEQLGEDPCLTVVQKTIKKTTSLEETDANEFAYARGLSEENKAKLFGRFFKATSKSSKADIYWTIPYAQGQACVIRDIKKL